MAIKKTKIDIFVFIILTPFLLVVKELQHWCQDNYYNLLHLLHLLQFLFDLTLESFPVF